MKKFIALTLASLIAFASNAQVTVKRATVGTEYGQADVLATKSTSSSLSAGAIVVLSNDVTVEFRNITSQSDSTATKKPGAPVSWQEFGVGYGVDVGITKLYAKEFFITNQKNNARFNSHATEVGAMGKFGSTAFGYQLGYRVINAFDNEQYKGHNTQIRSTVSYAIDKHQSVHLRHTKQRGDLDQNMLNVGYGYSF